MKDMNEKDIVKYNLKKSDMIKGQLTFPRKEVEEEKGIKSLRRRIINKTVLPPPCEYL